MKLEDINRMLNEGKLDELTNGILEDLEDSSAAAEVTATDDKTPEEANVDLNNKDIYNDETQPEDSEEINTDGAELEEALDLFFGLDEDSAFDLLEELKGSAPECVELLENLISDISSDNLNESKESYRTRKHARELISKVKEKIKSLAARQKTLSVEEAKNKEYNKDASKDAKKEMKKAKEEMKNSPEDTSKRDAYRQAREKWLNSTRRGSVKLAKKAVKESAKRAKQKAMVDLKAGSGKDDDIINNIELKEAVLNGDSKVTDDKAPEEANVDLNNKDIYNDETQPEDSEEINTDGVDIKEGLSDFELMQWLDENGYEPTMENVNILREDENIDEGLIDFFRRKKGSTGFTRPTIRQKQNQYKYNPDTSKGETTDKNNNSKEAVNRVVSGALTKKEGLKRTKSAEYQSREDLKNAQKLRNRANKINARK